MNATAMRIARGIARATVGRLPRPASRLHGQLAVHGGTPVRDVRFRPWSQGTNDLSEWVGSIGPTFRRIFMSGLEGLPQTRQREFSEAWAEYCGCKHGLMLPHGTDALRIAIAAVFDHDGLEYGGELIVPNLSFIASATAPLDRRFGVALVDVDPGTLNIDPARVEEAVVPGKTRGIVPVHQFGQPADMTALRAIAQRHSLKIIEDAAQAHGSTWETGPSGSLGDAAAFSFQTAKNLTCGEGGILTTNDPEVFTRAYSLHNAGRTLLDGSRWEHATLGWNCRPTEYQAALLLHRLKSFDEQQAVRARNFTALTAMMSDVACLRPLDVHPGVRKHGMYMFVMRYDPERCGNLSLDEFLHSTGAEGAPIYRCYSSTMSRQRVLEGLLERRPNYVRVMPTPVANKAAEEIVYISSTVLLGSAGEMEEIVAAIRKVERHYAGAAA